MSESIGERKEILDAISLLRQRRIFEKVKPEDGGFVANALARIGRDIRDEIACENRATVSEAFDALEQEHRDHPYQEEEPRVVITGTFLFYKRPVIGLYGSLLSIKTENDTPLFVSVEAVEHQHGHGV